MKNQKSKIKNQKLVFKKILPKIKQDVPLANYTTFKIGGPAKYFFTAKTKEDLIKTIEVAKRFKLPFFVLGGGSNLLVSDKGFNGLVIKIKNEKLKIKNYNEKFKIFVEAGAPLAKLVSQFLKIGATGLEWAIGMPGTVGGAIWGNAGAFGKSMADLVKEVEVLEIQDKKNQNDKLKFKIKKLKKTDCKFSYRDSIFKHKKNLIILSAKLQLKKGNKKEIQKKMKEYLNYRKKTQPLEFPSAGSIFKNPLNCSAGELIEKCGLKGKRIGDAKISEKHANFIVNLGRARTKDVINLINLTKKEVKAKFGIGLEKEIQYLGFKN